MEDNLRDSTRLQPPEVMGPFPSETQGGMELFVHCLHALAHSSEPTAEPLGPRRPALALGRAENLGARGPPPCRLVGLPLATLSDDIRAAGWGTNTRQPRVGIAAEGKEWLRQRLLLRTRSPTPAAGDPSQRGDRQEEMEALIPASAVAPPYSGSAREPARTTALHLPRRDGGAVQGFVRALLGCSQLPQVQKTRHECLIRLAHLAVALLPYGQSRKGGTHMLVGRALKTACTAQALPLTTDREGHYLAPREGRMGPWVRLKRQRGLAKIVYHDVQRGQEGVCVDHRVLLNPGEERVSL
jgi:hypothetical protein